jgi:hypothetical protein
MNSLVVLAAMSLGQLFAVNPQIPVVTYQQIYNVPQPVFYPTIVQYQPYYNYAPYYPVYNYNSYPYYNNYYNGYNPIQYSLYLRMNNLKIAP